MTGFSPTWTVYEIVNKNELFLPMLQYSWGKLASVRKSPRCPMNTLVMTGYLTRQLNFGRVLFCAFFDHDDVEFHKKRKKRTRLISSHAWSKRIYHTTKRFRFIKNQELIVYFESRERKLCS